MTDKKEKVSSDILIELKKIEKIKKARMLSSALVKLKEKAKQILILKRETITLLKEIGLCETDRKKVIDYVNSTVKLTPSDKRAVREDTQSEKDKIDSEIEKKIKDAPIGSLSMGSWELNGQSANITSGSGLTYASSGGSYCSATNTSSDLTVSLGGMALKL